MPYAFRLTTTIPASAQDIYDAWLDSLAHSEMTGGEASMSDELGAEVSAWDGYITGRNVELVPGERIVQTWRTTQFTDEHQDSIVTVVLEDSEDGTSLTLVHSNVPDEQTSYEQGGWQEHYFEPMKAYFAERRAGAEKKPRVKRKAKRAAGRMPKRAKPKAKKAAGRRKPKRAAATKAKARRAGKASKKPARGKRRR